MKVLRLAVTVLLALLVGLVGLSLLFSDLGPGETMLRRLITAALFFLITGFLVGYFNRDTWPMSALVAWGGILLTVTGLIVGPGADTFVLLGVSLVPALLGGYLGALTGTMFPPGGIVRRLRGRKGGPPEGPGPSGPTS